MCSGVRSAYAGGASCALVGSHPPAPGSGAGRSHAHTVCPWPPSRGFSNREALAEATGVEVGSGRLVSHGQGTKSKPLK